MSGSWKASLPCTRAEAEAAADDIGALALLDEPPVVTVSEPDPARPDDWLLEAHVARKPDAAMLGLLAALAPGAAVAPVVERVAAADWVTLSQAGLAPIRAGRFHVRTSASHEPPPADAIGFLIDAGRAFGTGHHETTTGCLMMLDRLRRRGAVHRDLLDLGTGTGLLAFAALRLWPRAHALASDIDPVSIEVTARNAAINGVALGAVRGRLGLVVADGMDHPLLRAAAPYDLVIANILAGPLIDLAPAIAPAVAPGGTLILAGLLDGQAARVARAYRRRGFRLVDRIDRGEWPTLALAKRRRC